MTDLTIDTTTQAYIDRRADFADIVQFYKPHLRAWHKLGDVAMQDAWRQADPFLDDLLRFAYTVSRSGSKGL
jgi:hypothetical protein